MTKVIAYVRVSTSEQAKDGVSLEAQESKIRQYASLYDLEIVQLIADPGYSAKSLARPGIQQALELLREGKAQGLLVAKLDRLTRSVKDLGALIEEYFDSEYTLFSVADQIDTRSANGRLVLNMLSSISQWEREIIGERTCDAMQHKKAKGEYLGGQARYGWERAGGSLVPVLAEQRVIRLAADLKAQGRSLREICEALATEGHLARAGKPFAPVQVSRMLAA